MKVKVYKQLTYDGARLKKPVGITGALYYDSNVLSLMSDQITHPSIDLHCPILLSISADGMLFRGMDKVAIDKYRLQEWWIIPEGGNEQSPQG